MVLEPGAETGGGGKMERCCYLLDRLLGGAQLPLGLKEQVAVDPMGGRSAGNLADTGGEAFLAETELGSIIIQIVVPAGLLLNELQEGIGVELSRSKLMGVALHVIEHAKEIGLHQQPDDMIEMRMVRNPQHAPNHLVEIGERLLDVSKNGDQRPTAEVDIGLQDRAEVERLQEGGGKGDDESVEIGTEAGELNDLLRERDDEMIGRAAELAVADSGLQRALGTHHHHRLVGTESTAYQRLEKGTMGLQLTAADQQQPVGIVVATGN